MGDNKVEDNHVSKYPHIPDEIPGAHMEAHIQPDDGAVQASPVPTMTYLAAVDQINADLAPTTGMSQTTGVGPTHNVVDLIDADDDDDNMEMVPTAETVPKVEDAIDKEKTVEDFIDTEETAQDETHNYGRGMRNCMKPVLYEPVMTGKTYKLGLITCTTEGLGTHWMKLYLVRKVICHTRWV